MKTISVDLYGVCFRLYLPIYTHCDFAEISTGDFIANHWFIDQIISQMPGKIIDRLIWKFLSLSNIYKQPPKILQLPLNCMEEVGCKLDTNSALSLDSSSRLVIVSMYHHHIFWYQFILWCDIFSGSWTSFSTSVPSSGNTSSTTRNMSTTLALPKMRLHSYYHFPI